MKGGKVHVGEERKDAEAQGRRTSRTPLSMNGMLKIVGMMRKRQSVHEGGAEGSCGANVAGKENVVLAGLGGRSVSSRNRDVCVRQNEIECSCGVNIEG